MMTEKDNFINSVNLNIDTDFPYLVMDIINGCSYPQSPGFQVMHWHEDLQFIYVLSGTICIKTLDNEVSITTGEGIFINKNVVHCVKQKGKCHYNSFVFPDYFLKFYFGSPAKALVDNVVEEKQFQIHHFSQNVDWCKKMLSILEELSSLEKNKTDLYAYEVLVRLSALWLIMRKNIRLPSERQHNIINVRMQTFLKYIEQHYSEYVTLEDLATSANVSKSECLRCFKESVQMSPYKYLLEYRLSKAATLLKMSDEPIGNIADSVGFRQMSHFGKCFKAKTGCSPREYRNQNS